MEIYLPVIPTNPKIYLLTLPHTPKQYHAHIVTETCCLQHSTHLSFPLLLTPALRRSPSRITILFFSVFSNLVSNFFRGLGAWRLEDKVFPPEFQRRRGIDRTFILSSDSDRIQSNQSIKSIYIYIMLFGNCCNFSPLNLIKSFKISFGFALWRSG